MIKWMRGMWRRWSAPVLYEYRAVMLDMVNESCGNSDGLNWHAKQGWRVVSTVEVERHKAVVVFERRFREQLKRW